MDKASLGAVAIVAAVAGGGMYFMREGHERHVADLHRQLEAARQQAAALEKAMSKREEEARLAFEKSRKAEAARARDAEAKRTADAAKAAQERVAAEPRAAESRAAEAGARSTNASMLYGEAVALEAAGNGPEAMKVYVQAARSGSGKAALRLGEIYDKGISGVERNYAESLKWYNAARVLGEQVPIRRSPSSSDDERAAIIALAVQEREHFRAVEAQFNQAQELELEGKGSER